MKKLGIVITEGVGFRNFVMSDFVTEVSKQCEEIIIYSGLPKSCYGSFDAANVKIRELPVFVEGKWTWFFRKWKELAHLQEYKTFYGMNDNLDSGYPKSNSVRALLIKGLYDIKSLWEPYYIFYLWLQRNKKQFVFWIPIILFTKIKFGIRSILTVELNCIISGKQGLLE
jgi:hypothetical protein